MQEFVEKKSKQNSSRVMPAAAGAQLSAKMPMAVIKLTVSRMNGPNI
jgi:hypothetical protein